MQLETWHADGYALKRGIVPDHVISAALHQVIESVRRDPPASHPGSDGYLSGEFLRIVKEKQIPAASVQNPEDCVSRVFNCHAEGACLDLSRLPALVQPVIEVLGREVDCFQSQCIFKNAGAIGQPWHQDSYYFPFDLEPQVGVWIALTDVTLDNGCLWVLPGSHRQPIRPHVADRRRGANAGYLEIVDHDFESAIPMIMNRGDALFFHSFLMHKSNDNTSKDRRVALALHYGRPGTKLRPAASMAELEKLTTWLPVSR